MGLRHCLWDPGGRAFGNSGYLLVRLFFVKNFLLVFNILHFDIIYKTHNKTKIYSVDISNQTKDSNLKKNKVTEWCQNLTTLFSSPNTDRTRVMQSTFC